MARLLDWPVGLGRVAYQRLTGPRSVGSSASESITGFVQTVASAFGVWRYQLSLQPLRKGKARQYRRMVTGLHGGANAVRVPFNDPDVLSFAEAGVTGVADTNRFPTVNWSNGEPWSNGQSWQLSRPMVPVAADAAVGDTIINLDDDFWGHTIDAGWLGFMPFHLGKYEITEVIEPGQYRIWPPLRTAINAGETYAHLSPVMAMRLEGEGAATLQRGIMALEGNVLTLVEVEDADVREFFAG